MNRLQARYTRQPFLQPWRPPSVTVRDLRRCIPLVQLEMPVFDPGPMHWTGPPGKPGPLPIRGPFFFFPSFWPPKPSVLERHPYLQTPRSPLFLSSLKSQPLLYHSNIARLNPVYRDEVMVLGQVAASEESH